MMTVINCHHDDANAAHAFFCKNLNYQKLLAFLVKFQKTFLLTDKKLALLIKS